MPSPPQRSPANFPEPATNPGTRSSSRRRRRRPPPTPAWRMPRRTTSFIVSWRTISVRPTAGEASRFSRSARTPAAEWSPSTSAKSMFCPASRELGEQGGEEPPRVARVGRHVRRRTRRWRSQVDRMDLARMRGDAGEAAALGAADLDRQRGPHVGDEALEAARSPKVICQPSPARTRDEAQGAGVESSSVIWGSSKVSAAMESAPNAGRWRIPEQRGDADLVAGVPIRARGPAAARDRIAGRSLVRVRARRDDVLRHARVRRHGRRRAVLRSRPHGRLLDLPARPAPDLRRRRLHDPRPAPAWDRDLAPRSTAAFAGSERRSGSPWPRRRASCSPSTRSSSSTRS